MALAIFSAGVFLGFLFGIVIMALLAMASLPSKPKRQRQSEVIIHEPTPLPTRYPLPGGQAAGLRGLATPNH